MSKIGKEPIKYDESVVVTVDNGGDYNNQSVTVKGKLGELTVSIRHGIKVEVVDGVITVTRLNNAKQNKAYHGLYRSLISNMIKGVTNGFTKKLEIHGVGYRGVQTGDTIKLNLGFSHQIEFKQPEGIKMEMPDESTIIISGIDKQLVGETAAKIRELRKPEPYKGKGIRYEKENVRRKSGKSGSA